MKNMRFEIILKNDKIKSYQNIAWIFLFFNFLIFIFLLFYDAYRYAALAFIIALGLYVLMRRYIHLKNKRTYFLDEFVFFIPAAGWFGLHNYGIAIACLVMGILFKLSLQKLTFVFSSDKVVKMNFPKKTFDWNAFSNVILKENMLTLDFKNNRLLQAELEPLQTIDVEEFNSFVASRLSTPAALS